MDAIGDGYSVSNPKPAPDLFIWVAGRLDVPPAQTVVFEDAEAGIEAALAGGMYAVGLGPPSRVGKAHLVLPNLDGVTVSAVLNALPEKP
jgi:kojibiose phosphorylase